MTRHATRIRSLPVAVALAAALTLCGAPAAQAATVHCGEVIAHSITVTNNVSGCPGDGLVVGADSIVVDVNGHSLGGTGHGSGVNLGGHHGVTLRNGKVHDFANGVYLSGDDNYVLRIAATSNTNGIFLEGANGNRVYASSGDGGSLGIVERYGSGNTLNGVSAAGNATGIEVSSDAYGPMPVTGNTTLINSRATNNDTGIVFYAQVHDVITKNVASGNSGMGFYLLELDATSQVSGNAATDNGNGFYVGSSRGATILVGNRAIRNGVGFTDYGKQSGGEQFIANSAQSNHYGFWISKGTDVVLRDNIAGSPSGLSGGGGGNLQDGILLDSFTTAILTGNRARGNAGDGIRVNPGSEGDMRDNETNRNGASGIEGLGAFKANSADFNHLYGLFAAPGSTDGGGNHAHNNGTANCTHPPLTC